MGCCQDKEVYVVCYWEEEGEWPPSLPSSSSGHHYSRSESHGTTGAGTAVPSRKSQGGQREVRWELTDVVPIAAPTSAAEGTGNGASPAAAAVAAAGSSCSVGSGALPATFPAIEAEEASLVTAAADAAATGAAEDIGKDNNIEELAVPATAPARVPLLAEQLFITGSFAKWVTDMPGAALIEDSLVDDGHAVRLRLCACLTSESLSFQVVSAEREWNWRLYPKGVKTIGFFHVSRDAVLWPGEPDKVKAGDGNSTEGHGLNFHVMGQAGDVVTIWVEVPVQRTSAGSHVLHTNSGSVAARSRARVWYTREDTGLQLTAGDGVDLNRYKWVKHTFGLG